MNNKAWWLNGEPYASVSPNDRGFAYGDGIFRTMRVHQGHLCFWDAHQQVFQNDAKRLFLKYPPQKTIAQSMALALSALQSFNAQEALIKLFLTRNDANTRGYWSPALSGQDNTDDFWVQILPYTPADLTTYNEGIHAGLCVHRLPIQPRLAGSKHLNRLEQVFLRRECLEHGWYEAVVLDAAGFLVEGTMSNLFWWQDGVLWTPMLDRAGVSGVMRLMILAWLKQTGIRWQEGHYSPARLLAADEVFFANSVQGIIPVRSWHNGETARQWQSFPQTHVLQMALHPWEN